MAIKSLMIDILNHLPSFGTKTKKAISKEDARIEIIVNQTNFCKFITHGISARVLSQLRSVLMSGVPTMSIDIVEIEENSSSIPDESIALRLGLIPIFCKNLEDYACFEECKCFNDGCNNCGSTFFLEVIGEPKTKTHVTSDDLYFDNENFFITHNSRFPIINLREGERLKLCGWILKGKGSIHTKWSPVSAVVFKQINDNSYQFSFESTGLLTTSQILEQAFKIMGYRQ